MYRRGLAAIRVGLVIPAAVLLLPTPFSPNLAIFAVLTTLMLGTLLGGIGVVYVQRVGVFDSGVYATVRRSMRIAARDAEPGYRQEPLVPALYIDGREIPRQQMRRIVVTRQVQEWSWGTIPGPEQFNACLVLADRVVRVETFRDQASAEALAGDLSRALSIELGSVAEIVEPYAISAELLRPMVPLVANMGMAMLVTFATFAQKDGGSRPWLVSVCILGLLLVDAATVHLLVTRPARTEAARRAIASFGLEAITPL
jgi:hypothetical protein